MWLTGEENSLLDQLGKEWVVDVELVVGGENFEKNVALHLMVFEGVLERANFVKDGFLELQMDSCGEFLLSVWGRREGCPVVCTGFQEFLNLGVVVDSRSVSEDSQSLLGDFEEQVFLFQHTDSVHEGCAGRLC